jgi:hypothetical protein
MKWIIGILSVISFSIGAVFMYNYFTNVYFRFLEDHLICGIGAMVFPVIILVIILVPVLAKLIAIKKTKKIVITISFILAILSAMGSFLLLQVRTHFHPGEMYAISVLKLLVSNEGTWKYTDADRNGIKDYWTLDISCLHRMYRANGTTKINMIDVAIARADDNPAFTGMFGEWPKIEDWTNPPVIKTTKSGYYCRAMLLDENGIPYNQNEVGTNKIKAANSNKFAFVAYPKEYDTYFSTYTLIVNEEGTIWQKDTKAEPVLQWPAKDPTTAGWQVAE